MAIFFKGSNARARIHFVIGTPVLYEFEGRFSVEGNQGV
jgi:hypothetical protein